MRTFKTAVLTALVVAVAASAAAIGARRGDAVTDPNTGDQIGELFYGVAPTRILDTRSSLGASGPVGPGQVIEVAVRGQGGVPEQATGVMLNLTAVSPTSDGFLSVFPDGAWPGSSSLNFVAGQVVANQVFSALSSGGSIRIFNFSGTTHVVADVVAFTSTSPTIPG